MQTRPSWSVAGAGLRTVTLPTVAAEALAEHLGVYAEAGPDGLGVLGRAWWPDPPQHLHRRVWIPTTRAAGVEGLRFHDLRHTAGTNRSVWPEGAASIDWPRWP